MGGSHLFARGLITAVLWLGGSGSVLAQTRGAGPLCGCSDRDQLDRRLEEAGVARREWDSIRLSARDRPSSAKVTLSDMELYENEVWRAVTSARYRNSSLSFQNVPGTRSLSMTVPDFCTVVVSSDATPCFASLLRSRESNNAAKCDRLKAIKGSSFTWWQDYLTLEEWADMQLESYDLETHFILLELRDLESCTPPPLQGIHMDDLGKILSGKRLLQ